MTPRRSASTSDIVVRLLLGALLTLLTGTVSWTLHEIISLRADVVVLQSTTLDNSDGEWFREQLSALSRDLAALPKEVPPAWFVERVDRLEDTIDSLLLRIEKIVDNRRDTAFLNRFDWIGDHPP